MDCFRKGIDGSLLEGRLSMAYTGTKREEDLDSSDLGHCLLRWTYDRVVRTVLSEEGEEENESIGMGRELNYAHYPAGEEYLNWILRKTAAALSPGRWFTVPVGGLRCLAHVRMWTRTSILVSLVADKSINR